METVIAFISFDTTLFNKFLMLSPTWHTSILQAMDEFGNRFENEFVAKYS